MNTQLPFSLTPTDLLHTLQQEDDTAPLNGATWYRALAEGDGLEYRFTPGTLQEAQYLTMDLLAAGRHLPIFYLALREGDTGPVFKLTFRVLNQCQARLRMPLEAVQQNRWRYPREGALLKPYCEGERVDLAKVDRITLTVSRKSDEPVCWCMTPLTATATEPPLLEQPLLPEGPLLDELGQSNLHEWPGKTRGVEELTAHLREQLAAAPAQQWPEHFSRWGGWNERRFDATGFFRTHHDGTRWWLVDPHGYAFWSAGMDCVGANIEAAYGGLATALTWLPGRDGEYAPLFARGEAGNTSINYLAANFIRTFGADQWYVKWAEIAFCELRRCGFNTVGNWSDWQVASGVGIPYVRPLNPSFLRTPLVYRDFPDVFHPAFAADATAYAEQLRETVDDPALIGYFLMNEPTWGFAQETPAAGMLFATPQCATRVALGEWLRQRYGADQALAVTWDLNTTLDEVAAGEWHQPLTTAAQADLAAFSTIMVEKLFGGLSDACRVVDPHHLNLGARYYTVPPAWALAGMKCFDVFSVNGYGEKVRSSELQSISAALDRPIIIGEWHFGALDVGLPASGIGHVRDQTARGQAFRVYTEDAAAQPWCVGVHYFTLYDQSALGRFDGENYNIGFLDVCNRPYEPLAAAARASHERVYQVAASQAKPYVDAPEYLPMLF